MTKLKDLRKKTRQELERQLKEAHETLNSLKRDQFVKEESNVRKARTTRKTIARINTLLNENAQVKETTKETT